MVGGEGCKPVFWCTAGTLPLGRVPVPCFPGAAISKSQS